MKKGRSFRVFLWIALLFLMLNLSGCRLTEGIEAIAGRFLGVEKTAEEEDEDEDEEGKEKGEKDEGRDENGEKSDEEQEEEGPLTREAFIRILVKSFGYDTSQPGNRAIIDLPEDRESYPFAVAALNHGIWSMEEGCFYPDRPMDRGTAVLWVMNGLGLYKEAENPFTDLEEGEEAEAVSIAVEKGFVSGYDDHTFRPDEAITREEAEELVGKAVQYRVDRKIMRENASNTVELQEGVVYTRSDQESNIPLEMNQGAMEILLGNIDDTVRQLSAGQILFIGNCENFPQGFLAKVESISLEGNNARIKVSQPQLGEVIKKADISAVFHAGPGNYTGDGDLALVGSSSAVPVGEQPEYYKNPKVDFGTKEEDGETSSDETEESSKADESSEAEESSKADESSKTEEPSKAEESSKESDSSETKESSEQKMEFDYDFDASGYYEDDAYLDWGGLHWSVYTGAEEGATVRFATAGAEKKEGFYASLDMALDAAVDLQIEADNITFSQFSVYTSVDTDVTGVTGYKDGGTAQASLDMPDCVIPVCGPISLTVEPALVMKAQGEFQVEASVELTNHLSFAFENGEVETENTSSANPSFTASAEGSVEVGPMLGIDIKLCDTPFFDGLSVIEGETEAGFGVNGKTKVEQKAEFTNSSVSYSGHQNTPDENGNIHVCYICFEGEFYAFFDGKIGIGSEIQEQVKKVFKDADMTFDPDKSRAVLGHWHYSGGPGYGPEFALELCPHIAYPITIQASEKGTNRPLGGVEVHTGGKGKLAGREESGATDGEGKALVYLENGVYDLSASKKDYEPDPYWMEFIVSGQKKTIPLELKRNSDEPLILRSSDMAIYEDQIYITRVNEDVEKYSYFSEALGKNMTIQYAPIETPPFPELNYPSGLAFYRDKLYFACKVPGTSDYDSAIYCCNPDGSGQELLAKAEWDGWISDCTHFIIMDGLLYFNGGRQYIDLESETREIKDADSSMKEIYQNGYNGYGWDSIYIASDYYYIDTEGIHSNVDGKDQLLLSWPARYGNDIFLVTEDSVFFGSHITETQSDALYRLDLPSGEVEKISEHMSAGGGGYFNW